MYTVIGILITVSGYLALNCLILFTEDFANDNDELAFGTAMVNIILGIFVILGGAIANSAFLLVGIILAALAVLEFISVKIHEGVGYKWLKAYRNAKVANESSAFEQINNSEHNQRLRCGPTPDEMKGRDKNSYDSTYDDDDWQ